MQLGFDLIYTDPVTHELVPWTEPTQGIIDRIRNSKWKVVDTETTGLNPSSAEQNFSGKDLRRGVNPVLRLRVLSVLLPSIIGEASAFRVFAFDFDQISSELKKTLSQAAMSKVVVGHNIGFDAYWLGIYAEKIDGLELLLDTMLMSRILCPEQVLLLAKMCSNEEELFEYKSEAEMVFKQGRSGWSLADLSLTLLRTIVSKEMQGPKNWCEPFLSQKSYDYASGDTVLCLRILLKLLELDELDLSVNPDSLLDAYFQKRKEVKALKLIEPQVLDIVMMRQHGMPWDQKTADEYVEQQWLKVKSLAKKMVELEPNLAPYEAQMADAESGVSANLKQSIGEAFSKLGLELDTTEKTGAFKIGEKDLRRVKAQINENAKVLFDTWVALNRAKKAGSMAKEVSKFAKRSKTLRLHPNTGHGPVTGRLSSSEPNCQQFPRDQGFRNAVKARKGYKIIASDYSALDMRVGAALAIRCQQQILEVYKGVRFVDADVEKCIRAAYDNVISAEQALKLEKIALTAFNAHKEERDTVAEDARKTYWDKYRRLARSVLLTGFQRCLAQVLVKARSSNEETWGALRDAFRVPGMDIHTWTALSMKGIDPKKLFEGLDDKGIADALKKHKKELGDARMTGKVGNLSLLYAMKTLGLVEAAAKNYNIHWSFEEADKVRVDWLAAYVEIDLWHKWMELNPYDSAYIPDNERGGKYVKKQVYASVTLGDRLIYAFGLNAALSYEDQSTGADILGTVMRTLKDKYSGIFDCVVNQVHDELVFEVPDDKVESYNQAISQVMTECAEYFLMPYGIKGECSPAIGDVWLKD